MPDLDAGCSLADMANLSKVQNSWDQLSEVFDINKIIPITYINSSADLKSFCGKIMELFAHHQMQKELLIGRLVKVKKYFFP